MKYGCLQSLLQAYALRSISRGKGQCLAVPQGLGLCRHLANAVLTVLCYNKQSLKENSESAHYMAVHVKVGCACLVPSQHWAVLVWLATEKVSWQSQLRFLACSQYSFRLSGLVGQYRVCNYGQCKIGLPFWPASQKAACKSLKGNAHLFVSF